MLSKTSSAARVAKAATSQVTQKAPPATKRKRTTSAITTTAAVKEEGSTVKKAKSTVPTAYTPTLLPPTLSFSLGDAKYHLSRHDPRFGHMFDNIPCKPYAPPIEAIDPFKTLVTSIIGQQVSWMAARAINKRFKELFGFTDDAHGFPSPEQVASEDPLRLKSVGLSMRKAEYGEPMIKTTCQFPFRRTVTDAANSDLPLATLHCREFVNRASARWLG